MKPRATPKAALSCDACGAGQARIRRMTRTYGTGKDLLVVENLPVVSCPACGERSMTARTLHEIERLRRHRRRLAAGRRVGVVRFAASAAAAMTGAAEAATRNTADVAATGVPVFNPWKA